METHVHIKSGTLTIEHPEIDCCPRCHTSIEPILLTSALVHENEHDSITTFTILYKCNKCKHPFMVEFQANQMTPPDYYQALGAISIFPTSTQDKQFSELICRISEKFVALYNQSQTAEVIGLSDICGMGYRKALEFLVKDFAIYMHPEDESNIKSQPLGQCIDKYIDNSKIKRLAKATTWLGNDETHYEKRHEEYSLSKLKTFLNTVVSAIEFELQVIEADKLLTS